MLFESYEAMSAYGSWFSGVLTAIAVFSSLVIAFSTNKKKIGVFLHLSQDGFTLGVSNEGKDPILIRNLGIYLGGNFFDLVEIDYCLIMPGTVKTYEIGEDRWDLLSGQISYFINSCLNNTSYMQKIRLLKGEEKRVDGETLQRTLKYPYVSFKIGIQSSDAMYITKKWLTLPMLDPHGQKGFQRPNHYYDTRRIVPFDASALSMMIMIFILFFGMVIYHNENYSAMMIYAILTIVLYYVVSIQSIQSIHPASYYVVWCVTIGLCVSALVHMSLLMTVYQSILIEATLWLFVVFGIVPRMLRRTGLMSC